MEKDASGPTELFVPSWLRAVPNCCESCKDWSPDSMTPYAGKCNSGVSLDSGEKTDSRYRCPTFERKAGM